MQERIFGGLGLTPAIPLGSTRPMGTSCGCSLSRDGLGRYLVQHRDAPGQRWVAANLPSAHALCCRLTKPTAC